MQYKFSTAWVALAVVAIAACAQFNPISKAETSQQRALAAYGTVTIMVEQIAALLAPDTLPDRVQERLIVAATSGAAVARAGLLAYNEAESARAAFVADSTQQGRLNAALSSLDAWATDASTTIEAMKTIMREAR
jgi:drug/metabolite transporter superfamily protein YnfA